MILTSLGQWLALLAREDVALPAIEAALVGEPRREDLLALIWERELTDELAAVLERARAMDEPGTMLRWDPAAMPGVKRWANAGHGAEPPDEDARRLLLDDPRLFDILAEYPSERVPLWRRPWVEAAVVGAFPVEFRAFAREGDVVGVSSYYPQRPLPDRYEAPARTVWALAERCTPHVEAFTLDFLLTPDGELLVLEGGPPHDPDPVRGGAHPCCFAPGAVEGIALTPREGALGR